ncbi:hypothetical protein [Mesorhizobium sp. ES1-4]|uniref:hypothetical protein n=1 Tax=Mesorhizobium sp. ES1-4 TaxID=2876627 RepID=UPI001CCCBD79|nr:hypothetical protein [Mesorhizobium sp. ES1-4]MBZ9799377.1 hypothetical protein [Mesorhizobium sp. ES1-4]
MDRFEILNEPTGTYSIFDRDTDLPVMVEGRAFIGLRRHEVPLALLAAIEPDHSGMSLAGVNHPNVGHPNISDATCNRE